MSNLIKIVITDKYGREYTIDAIDDSPITKLKSVEIYQEIGDDIVKKHVLGGLDLSNPWMHSACDYYKDEYVNTRK